MYTLCIEYISLTYRRQNILCIERSVQCCTLRPKVQDAAPVCGAYNTTSPRLYIWVHLFAVMIGLGNYTLYIQSCVCKIQCIIDMFLLPHGLKSLEMSDPRNALRCLEPFYHRQIFFEDIIEIIEGLTSNVALHAFAARCVSTSVIVCTCQS